MATTPTTVGISSTGDFVTTTLNGAISAGATSMTIGTGLNIPAANGFLMIDPDSSVAVGSDTGPETVKYSSYTSGTGAVTGLTRGADAFTSGVAHNNGATVHAGLSALHLNNLTDIIENAAWTSFVPTWTNFTVSGSTVDAKYTRIGKMIDFKIKLTVGGGNTPSGSVSVSLPITAITHGTTPFFNIGQGSANDGGSVVYPLSPCLSDVNTVAVFAFDASAVYTFVNATVPFTWANTDILMLSGRYEAA